MKTITVKCEHCGNNFNKALKEYNRCSKIGRKHFCNLSCAAAYRNSHLSKKSFNNQVNHLKSICANRLDKFTPFRYIIYKLSNRNRQIDITPEYIKDLWEKQNGVCPYTGLRMFLPKMSNDCALRQASLDRIDSSKGYVKDNVEFVCLFINLAKNKYNRDDVMKIISDIKNSIIT